MRRVAAMLVGLLLPAVLWTAPASAHAAFVSMDPEPGSTVMQMPTRVQLTFSEDVQAIGTRVAVIDPDGHDVGGAGVMVQGAKVTVGLQQLLIAGVYHVNFRVLAVDGHVTTESRSFVYMPAGATAKPHPPTTDAVGTSWGFDPTIVVSFTAFVLMLVIVGFVLFRYVRHRFDS